MGYTCGVHTFRSALQNAAGVKPHFAGVFTVGNVFVRRFLTNDCEF